MLHRPRSAERCRIRTRLGRRNANCRRRNQFLQGPVRPRDGARETATLANRPKDARGRFLKGLILHRAEQAQRGDQGLHRSHAGLSRAAGAVQQPRGALRLAGPVRQGAARARDGEYARTRAMRSRTRTSATSTRRWRASLRRSRQLDKATGRAPKLRRSTASSPRAR